MWDRWKITENTHICHDHLNEVGQARVDKVSDDTDRLRFARVQRLLHIASHILLQHCLHVPAAASIFLEDCLTAEQSTLFGAVPMELKRVGRLALNNVLILQ